MECPICLGTFTDPVVLPRCGHSFCRPCLRAVRPCNCPVCRLPYHYQEAVPNFALRDTGPASNTRQHAARRPPQARPIVAQQEPQPVPQPARRGDGGVEGAIERLTELGMSPPMARIVATDASTLHLRVVLLDNSGSTAAYDGKVMKQPANGGPGVVLKTATRWEEIKQMAVTMAQLSLAAGVPCEFRLLNPAPRQGVVLCTVERGGHGVDHLERVLKEAGDPRGATPLASRLRDIRHHLQDVVSSRNGQVCVVVATDGLPTGLNSGTPTVQAQMETVQEIKALGAAWQTRLVVRLCTDDDSVVRFWNSVDAEVELVVDVIDDYISEAKEVLSNGNGWLAYTPLLHAIREAGAPTALLDLLDERRLSPPEAATLAEMLVVGGDDDDVPDWQFGDGAEFFEFMQQHLDSAPAVFDAHSRRMVPPINLKGLKAAIHPSHTPGAVVLALALIVLVLFFVQRLR